MKHLLRKSTLAASCLALAAMSARADLIDVNFFSGNFGGSAATGPAVVGNVGDQWNGINGDSGSGSVSGLTDVGGLATGVSLSYDTHGGGAVLSLNVNNQPNPSLMNQYLFNNSRGPIVLTIQGLAPSTTYDLYVYVASGDGGAGDRDSLITVNGVSQAFATGVPSSSFVNGQNYVLLTPTTDPSGHLTIFDTNAIPFNTSGEIDMNGIQIQDIPTNVPDQTATLPLLALSAFGLLLLARRGKTARA